MAALAKQSTIQATTAREFKHRVLTCLNKLSDRDTYSAAATELESIAKTLRHDCIPPFLSLITTTGSSDKSPVRKQCVRLISLLSQAHGNFLSPHLSKLLSSIIRRLCDPNSAVRSACVTAISSISSHITKPPFTSIAKPLVDALVTEQDTNSQIGAALCLAAAIDGSPEPEPVFLKRLLPRLEKLLRSRSFKAKAALLTVFVSVIGTDGALSQQGLRNLVKCLVEFVSSEDWAARKAAAEALAKLAVVERNELPEYKASCLKTFEAKRFDKVKVVRETMNQMVEAWREIPDVPNEVSPPRDSQSSSEEVATDGCYPPGSITLHTISSGAPQVRKNYSLANVSPSCDGSSPASALKRSPLDCSINKTGPAMLRKLDHKALPANWKVDIAAPSLTVVSGDSKDRDEKVFDKDEEEINRFRKLETRRTLFGKDSYKKINKFYEARAGSRVVLYHDEVSGSTAVASTVTEDLYRNQKEFEDLSLIRKQLLQIENQQSSLLDLFQGFVGSSQDGMHYLESRVHGLELVLDEISLDLAVSTRRMPNTDSAGAMCCKLPGAEFISSKLWKRTEGRQSTSRYFASGGTSSVVALHNMGVNKTNTDTSKLENRRFGLQGGGGFIVNPLAEVHNDPQGFQRLPQIESQRMSMVPHNTSSVNHVPEFWAGQAV